MTDPNNKLNTALDEKTASYKGSSITGDSVLQRLTVPESENQSMNK